MPLLTASSEINQRQRRLIVEKLQAGLKVLRGRVITVFGLAFKPHTDDVRESPAIALVRMLADLGAHVRAHDPVAIDKARHELSAYHIEFIADPYRAAEGTDALVLATEWDEYRTLDLTRLAKAMRHAILIDGRNLFRATQARAAGFIYSGIGT